MIFKVVFNLAVPNRGGQFVGEWLGTGEVWQPTGVVGQFLVEEVVEVEGFQKVLDVLELLVVYQSGFDGF